MSGDDERPDEVLGAALWNALDAVDDASLPEGFDAGFRARLAEEEGRDALGTPLWEVLGAAAEVPEPVWRQPANRVAPSWRRWLGVAVVVAAVFLVVPVVRRATTPPAPVAAPLELAMVRDLELAEHLDLLADPDFDVILAWDGEEP